MFAPRLHLDDNRSSSFLDISRSRSLSSTITRDSDPFFVTSVRNLPHTRTSQQQYVAENTLSLSTHRTLSTRSTESMVLDHVSDTVAASSCSYQEDAKSPRALGASEKANSHQHQKGAGSESPSVEESAETRIARLGKQRPEVFKSLWAEIGFVFAISMSQVLSVRHFVSLLLTWTSLKTR